VYWPGVLAQANELEKTLAGKIAEHKIVSEQAAALAQEALQASALISSLQIWVVWSSPDRSSFLCP